MLNGILKSHYLNLILFTSALTLSACGSKEDEAKDPDGFNADIHEKMGGGKQFFCKNLSAIIPEGYKEITQPSDFKQANYKLTAVGGYIRAKEFPDSADFNFDPESFEVRKPCEVNTRQLKASETSQDISTTVKVSSHDFQSSQHSGKVRTGTNDQGEIFVEGSVSAQSSKFNTSDLKMMLDFVKLLNDADNPETAHFYISDDGSSFILHKKAEFKGDPRETVDIIIQSTYTLLPSPEAATAELPSPQTPAPTAAAAAAG